VHDRPFLFVPTTFSQRVNKSTGCFSTHKPHAKRATEFTGVHRTVAVRL
jgi:hypothetical protein